MNSCRCGTKIRPSDPPVRNAKYMHHQKPPPAPVKRVSLAPLTRIVVADVIAPPASQADGSVGPRNDRVSDADFETRVQRAVRQRADSGQPGTSGVGRLVVMSEDIRNAIEALGTTVGRRIWVVDQSGWVRVRTGSLAIARNPVTINPLFRWLLTPPRLEDEPTSHASKLEMSVVRAALGGAELARWRRSARAEVPIVSAAHPIRLNHEVVGAVVVEENASSIQTVRRQALADLFLQTVGLAFLAALALLWFASTIAGRLQRLRDQANAAIDRHGRVVGTVKPTRASDEIGDLSRSVTDMLERLRRYNDYLEQLANRLSHELRTPIAVIRSSLENLEQAEPSETALYTERAMKGLGRLNMILARMSESTRIEHAHT